MVENDFLLDLAAIKPTLMFFWRHPLCTVSRLSLIWHGEFHNCLSSLPLCRAKYIQATDDCVVMRRNPACQPAACTCVWVSKWISCTRICTEGLHFIASTVCIYKYYIQYVCIFFSAFHVFISPQNSAGSETSYCSREFTSWSGNRLLHTSLPLFSLRVFGPPRLADLSYQPALFNTVLSDHVFFLPLPLLHGRRRRRDGGGRAS